MNRLEALLYQAAEDPGAIPEFYAELLRSTVFVIGHSDTPGVEHGETLLPTGSQASLQTWEAQDGTMVIPFFSSLETLGLAIEDESSYLGLEAVDLFTLVRGSTLVLNPRSDTSKWFGPEEIDSLAEGRLPQSVETVEIEEETSILVGQPREFPSALVSALTTYFAKTREVREAYLLQAVFPDKPEPTLLIGMELSGDASGVFEEAALVASNATDHPCSFVLLEETGLADAFREQDPIYRAGWGDAMKQLLES